MPTRSIQTLAFLSLATAAVGGCAKNDVPPRAASPTPADIHLTIESTNTGAIAKTDCDAATDAWAIDVARQALEAREDVNDWPHGAEYQLLRRSAVQWWVTARRIDGYDDSGKPRFTSPWDRGIIIDDLGSVMFYVPAK